MPSVKKKSRQRKVILVTGLSGAGMSSALKIFEDLGYEVFDNFPLDFVPALLDHKGHEDAPVAFGLDTRSRGFAPDAVLAAAEKLRADPGIDVTLIFMTAGNLDLQKRFSHTRRSHPLAKDRPVLDGIRRERTWLKTLMDGADLLIDTSDLSIHDLRRVLESSAHPDETKRKLAVTVMSFGFKQGVPRESDMVIDVRFLQNPHWVPALKDKTGLDKKVQAYVAADPDFKGFMDHTESMLSLLLPRYADEGKYYFTLAIGCTGGRHRSVYIAELLSKRIKSMGYTPALRHRDISE